MLGLVSLARLSNADLLASLTRLVQDHSRLTAALVAHLAEVERRRLHAVEGYSSLFGYCTRALHLSEHEAYLRIHAARVVRRFPAVLDALATGELTLSAIKSLAPHLTPDNQIELLQLATHRTTRELERLLAERFPQPDVPTRLRRLPAPRSRAVGEGTPEFAARRVPEAAANGSETTMERAREAETEAANEAETEAANEAETATAREAETATAREAETATAREAETTAVQPSARALGHGRVELAGGKARPPHPPSKARPPHPPSKARPPHPPSRITPLAPRRYKLEVTLSEATRDKLEEARDLLRHAVPSGDLDEILGLALAVLIEQTQRRRFGAPRVERTATKRKCGGSTGSSVRAEHVQPAHQSSSARASTSVRSENALPNAAPDSVRSENALPNAAPDSVRTESAPPNPARASTSVRTENALPNAAPDSVRTENALLALAPDSVRTESAPPNPASASSTCSEAPVTSRRAPARVRRAVFERDGGRCSYVAPDGNRCGERAALELNHRVPYARGGAAEASNLELTCRAHNLLHAEREFGGGSVY